MRFFSRPEPLDDDPVVDSYIQSHISAPGKLVTQIDSDDEMFLFDLEANKGSRTKTAVGYYMIGARIFYAIKQLGTWHFGRLGRVRSFLDFACGYGRSTGSFAGNYRPGASGLAIFIRKPSSFRSDTMVSMAPYRSPTRPIFRVTGSSTTSSLHRSLHTCPRRRSSFGSRLC